MKKYKIRLEGVFDRTEVEVWLAPEEVVLLRALADKLNETATGYAQPRMYLKEADE